jgi:signal recognition particle GTPase
MAAEVVKHKLLPAQGAGSVVLYDVKGDGTPPVVTNSDDIKGFRWVLVLFPERWGWPTKSRVAGVREARGESPTLAALLLKREKKPKKKPKKAAEKPKKGEGVTRARTHTNDVETPKDKGKSAVEESKGDEQEEEKEKPKRPEIPANATFEQALDIRFPVERIMDDLEDLIEASTPIYGKEGDYLGEKPDFPTRMHAVKTAISYREGLARVKEKELAEPKRISFDELEAMLLENPLACETLERVIHKARQHQAMKKADVGLAKKPKTP